MDWVRWERRARSPNVSPSPTLRILCLTLAASAGTSALFLSNRAQAQLGGAVPAFLRLQASTPGTSQIGNSNITGRSKAGSFEGTGTLLTGLNANNFSAGLLSPSRGGLGIDTSSASPGALLYATGSGWATLEPGNEGQTLGLVSGQPAWIDTTGFTMPFDYSGDDGGLDALFRVSNTGTAPAIFGNTDNVNGIGVKGTASDTSDYSYGGYFLAAGPLGRAVYASNTATSGPAIAGRFGSSSPDSVVIYSTASAATGDATAIWGESFADSGTGVVGAAFGVGSFSVGVEGSSPATEGAGVFGRNTSPTGRSAGLMGITGNVGSGFAIVSIGNLGVLGNKQFVIDHPLDPENKYLHHYCSEGPAPYNIYKGRVTTDQTGFAWIQLPDYYGEINRDPDYQLTVIDSGNDFVLAKVTDEVQQNRFRIRTSKPNVKVCWEVKATRNDRFERAYGAPIETEKSPQEKGKYQWPKLYGKPESQGIYYDLTKQRSVNHKSNAGP